MYEVLQQYIMLMAVSVRGTFEELEAYAERVAGGYRPPLLEKWPPEVSSLIQVCMLAGLGHLVCMLTCDKLGLSCRLAWLQFRPVVLLLLVLLSRRLQGSHCHV